MFSQETNYLFALEQGEANKIITDTYQWWIGVGAEGNVTASCLSVSRSSVYADSSSAAVHITLMSDLSDYNIT